MYVYVYWMPAGTDELRFSKLLGRNTNSPCIHYNCSDILELMVYSLLGLFNSLLYMITSRCVIIVISSILSCYYWYFLQVLLLVYYILYVLVLFTVSFILFFLIESKLSNTFIFL